jgi:hypothetical protein
MGVPTHGGGVMVPIQGVPPGHLYPRFSRGLFGFRGFGSLDPVREALALVRDLPC